jgi:hypothetical protein
MNVNVSYNDKVYTILFGSNGSIANLKQLFQLQVIADLIVVS